MRDERTAPERPRVEPEILPPDRARSGRRNPPYFDMDAAPRVYVTRIGPVGGALLILVIALLVAVGGLLFLSALLISVPLVALLLIIGTVVGLLRSRRW